MTTFCIPCYQKTSANK